MRNEKGSAVVVVLLFLGIVSMIGAGLMLQSRLDVQFTSAVKGVDTQGSIADNAASIAFKKIPFSVPSSGASVVATDSGVSRQQIQKVGSYSWRVIYVDRAPSTPYTAGFEMAAGGGGSYGGNYYAAYWVAEGTGRTAGSGDAEARVQMGVVKLHSGK